MPTVCAESAPVRKYTAPDPAVSYVAPLPLVDVLGPAVAMRERFAPLSPSGPEVFEFA